MRRLNGSIQTTITHALAVNEAVQTRDGSQVVGVDARGRVTLSSNANGQLQRAFTTPRGTSHCQPGRMLAKTPSCGPGQWGLVQGKRWTVLPRTGENRGLVGVTGNGRVGIVQTGGCGRPGVLEAQNLSTGAANAVMAGGKRDTGQLLTSVATAARDN